MCTFIDQNYKMPAQELLDINPDELFEKHGIDEIKKIQIQIQNEIEKKREDLRSMVGEKCRDLLKAADTITEMKETTNNIILGIGQMRELCAKLQARTVSGFRHQNNSVTIKLQSNAEEISRIIEIKILLSLPEQIWTAIDHKDYLLATQLFSFATHLHLGLEVSSSAQKLSNKYPVLNKQWEIVRTCKKLIIDGVHKQLKVINLSHQKATDCLCSMALLDVMSYEKLLIQFLDLRFEALKNLLNSEELSRKKLKSTVELIQHTLAILFACFLEKPGKSCLIQERLDSIIKEEEKPAFTKTSQISSLPQRYLSPLIVNYRLRPSSKLVTLSQSYIKSVLTSWLENVEKFLQLEITKLLLLTDNIKRLHKIIKEEVFSVENPQNWNDIVNSLFEDNKFNLYHKFIKSYVTKRIKDLIEISWQNNLKNILISLTKMEEDALKDKKKQQENDIRWFVWKENKVDTEECLKLKTLGYTYRVIELCSLVNSFLSELLEQVKSYVEDDALIKSKSNNNNSFNSTNNSINHNTSDNESVLPFLNKCSFQMVKRLTKEITDSYKERGDGNNESGIIIRARFLSSLTILCPTLEECLKHNLNLQEDIEENKMNLWQEASIFLNDESIQMWHKWKTLTSLKFRKLIKSKLDVNISLRNLLKSKPLSEVVTIEEQTEDDTTIKSDLRVPSQPSLPLQELLFQVCQQLNAIAPATLPRQIHQDLVDTLVKDLLEHYQEWSKSEVIYQSQAWQMLLDIRFLTLLMITKENKDLSQSVCETLEKTIDPFDLDVYFPHLQNSVKKSAQKLQGTFGILINFTEKLPVFNGLKLTQTTSRIEEPNLLAVSNNAPWFPLLPVPSGSKRTDASRFDGNGAPNFKEFSSEKTSLRSKEKEGKKESVTSDFFKSAGAFFDAMTGGWS